MYAGTLFTLKNRGVFQAEKGLKRTKDREKELETTQVAQTN